MFKESFKGLLKLMYYADILVITDNEGYIEFFKVFKAADNKLIENPIGLHILDFHKNFNGTTSTVMKVLKTKEPIINERQRINISSEESTEALCTTLPIMVGDEIMGIIDICKYRDKDSNKIEGQDIKVFPYIDNYLLTIDNVLTVNPIMAGVKDRVLRAAKTSSPVMIYGETGTGKNLIAQAIHNHSIRRDKPFIVQNCSAVPLTLGESIFFGTTKGSFTGSEDRKGLFEMAHGGTMVLDELNSMDTSLQAKLLRTTESNSIRRVGGTSVLNVDVRLISTLSQEPMLAMDQDKLRRDFFYRMGVVLIHIPPLREKKEDIPLLTDSFIEEYNFRMNKAIKGVSQEVEDLFMEYNWPGNVRELKHAIESAFNFIDRDIIERNHLPIHINNRFATSHHPIHLADEFSLNDALRDLEIKYIKLALASSDTLYEAAKLLKISRQTLKYRMDSYGINME